MAVEIISWPNLYERYVAWPKDRTHDYHYSYFRLSENKTIYVFPTDYIVQLLKLRSQWDNK